MNSHLLPLFISYGGSGEKLIKYQANSSCVFMFIILMTTLLYKALMLYGEIWCWSLLGLKGLFVCLGYCTNLKRLFCFYCSEHTCTCIHQTRVYNMYITVSVNYTGFITKRKRSSWLKKTCWNWENYCSSKYIKEIQVQCLLYSLVHEMLCKGNISIQLLMTRLLHCISMIDYSAVIQSCNLDVMIC